MSLATGFIVTGMLCAAGIAGAMWMEARVLHRTAARHVPTGRRRGLHRRTGAVPGGGPAGPARPLRPGQRVPSP